MYDFKRIICRDCWRFCADLGGRRYINCVRSDCFSIMTSNLTRFYFNKFPSSTEGGKVFVDMETIEADQYELDLQAEDVDYTRIDL